MMFVDFQDSTASAVKETMVKDDWIDQKSIPWTQSCNVHFHSHFQVL